MLITNSCFLFVFLHVCWLAWSDTRAVFSAPYLLWWYLQKVVIPLFSIIYYLFGFPCDFKVIGHTQKMKATWSSKLVTALLPRWVIAQLCGPILFCRSLIYAIGRMEISPSGASFSLWAKKPFMFAETCHFRISCWIPMDIHARCSPVFPLPYFFFFFVFVNISKEIGSLVDDQAWEVSADLLVAFH